MLVRDPALAERLRFVGLIGWSPKVVGSHARLAVLQIGAASDARDLRHAHTLLGFAHEDRRVQRDAGPAQWAGACCCRLRGKGPRQALGTEDVAAGRTTRLRWRRREADGAFQLARHVGAALRPGRPPCPRSDGKSERKSSNLLVQRYATSIACSAMYSMHHEIVFCRTLMYLWYPT